MHKIRIWTDEGDTPSPQNLHIELDGKELTHVIGITFRANLRHGPVVAIEFLADVEIDTSVVEYIPTIKASTK